MNLNDLRTLEAMESMRYFMAFSAGLFGAIFGSFLNVLIFRLPRGLSVVFPRSACPQCKHQIQAFDNIPIASWLLLGGRCRNCRARISPRYVFVELLTAILFFGSIMKFGIGLEGLKFCIFGFLILGLIFIDADFRILPDVMTLPGLLLGLVFSLAVPVAGWGFLVFEMLPRLNIPAGAQDPLLGIINSLLGAIVGAGFIYLISVLYFQLRGVQGMGFGDVKLMGMIGAFLGVNLTLITLFCASLLGMFFGIEVMLVVWLKRTRRLSGPGKRPFTAASSRAWQSAQTVYRHYQIPFGVFLGSTALLAIFFGNQLIHWYWHLYL